MLGELKSEEAIFAVLCAKDILDNEEMVYEMW
jgi:hypothetical protein